MVCHTPSEPVANAATVHSTEARARGQAGQHNSAHQHALLAGLARSCYAGRVLAGCASPG
ncbi:MAG: hypothetical protein ACRDHP_13660 [Ktedonobacterales bacterium]